VPVRRPDDVRPERRAWMWNSVCSLVSQLMPSTGDPAAAVPVPASAGAEGTGTPSGPCAPAAGAGLRVPSVLSAAYCGDADDPPLTPSVTATAIAAAATIDVFDELLLERAIAYTTVMSTMDNLHRKGWLARDKERLLRPRRPVSAAACVLALAAVLAVLGVAPALLTAVTG